MAPPQIRERRNKCLQMIEPLHNHCQSLDELAALLCQVGGLEERPRRCVNLEKSVVEKSVVEQARRRV
jgi:hypothetical protein